MHDAVEVKLPCPEHDVLPRLLNLRHKNEALLVASLLENDDNTPCLVPLYLVL